MSDAEAKEDSRKSAGETEADLLKMTGQSQVYTATRDTLFPKKITQTRTHALVSMSCLVLFYIEFEGKCSFQTQHVSLDKRSYLLTFTGS